MASSVDATLRRLRDYMVFGVSDQVLFRVENIPSGYFESRWMHLGSVILQKEHHVVAIHRTL
jgi:hypothetical protein